MPQRLFHCTCHPAEVWLTPDECGWADAVGDERLRRAIHKGRVDRGGKDEGDSHRFGARAELAMARILEVEWPAHIDTFRAVPDLPPDIEVRGAHGAHGLKMRTDDVGSPGRFVLIVHRPILDTWRFVGWCRGADVTEMGLKPERRREDLAPAYWVPVSALRSPVDLIH